MLEELGNIDAMSSNNSMTSSFVSIPSLLPSETSITNFNINEYKYAVKDKFYRA